MGNVLIGAHTGGLIRFGYNLPDDFGPTRPSATDGDSFVSPPSKDSKFRKSYYVFGGVRGNLVLRNIFLDGNSIRSSHRVTKLPFVHEWEFGTGLQIIPFVVVWSFVTRSPEFEQRKKYSSFASLNFTYLF